MMPLKGKKIKSTTKTVDIASSMTGGLSASARFGSRDSLSAWDGVGLPASLVKYGRGQNESNMMNIADMAVSFVTKLKFQLEAKAVKNVDISNDAMGCGDKSILHGEIRCLEPNFKHVLTENGGTRLKTPEKWGKIANSAAENTYAHINKVAAKNCCEEVARATPNSNELPELVTKELMRNTVASTQVPRKTAESGQAFYNPGLNSNGVRQIDDSDHITSTKHKDEASENVVLTTDSSNPIRLGEKIKSLLQNLIIQFKRAINHCTLKQKSINEYVQNASSDMAIDAVENRTGEMLSVNSSKNNLAESRIKSLLIADKTILRALSYKAIKQATKVPATKLQTLNFKNDSMLSPVKFENVTSEIFRGVNSMFKTNAYINNLVNFITGSRFAPKSSILHVHRDKFVTNKPGVTPATKLTLNQVSGLALGNQTETILECDSQAGELNMYSRKFTTKNFKYQVGEKLSQVRDKISTRRLRSTKQIAEFTPKVVVTSSQSTCSVKQLPHVATTAPTIGEKFMQRSKVGLIHLATKGGKKMARGLVALLNTIAPVAAINNTAIMRTLKVASMAGVIIGAGLVVLPVSDAQAQKVSWQVNSSLTASDRERPAENSEARIRTFNFQGLSGDAGDYGLVFSERPDHTATEGVDYMILTDKFTHNGSSTLATIQIQILQDGIDEDDELISLNVDFADPAKSIFQSGAVLQNRIQIAITIRDSRTDVGPLVTTNYPDSNTLEVSKDIDAFDLEFNLRRIIFDDNSNPTTVLSGETIVSSRNVDIGYTVSGTATGILTNDSVSIPAGESIGTLPISLSGKTISADQTLILTFTLTNAAFAYTVGNNNIPSSPTVSETLTITFVDKPSVSIETVASEVAQSDFVEFVVEVEPATHSDALTVEFTESGIVQEGLAQQLLLIYRSGNRKQLISKHLMGLEIIGLY